MLELPEKPRETLNKDDRCANQGILDDIIRLGNQFDLVDDGLTHEVVVMMGVLDSSN